MKYFELADLRAAEQDLGAVRPWDRWGRSRSVDVPAVRPDRVGGGAGLLALAGVDRLEVVDVAVGLVEVAVAVVVVAVPHVELGEVLASISAVLPSRGHLLGVPGVAVSLMKSQAPPSSSRGFAP